MNAAMSDPPVSVDEGEAELEAKGVVAAVKNDGRLRVRGPEGLTTRKGWRTNQTVTGGRPRPRESERRSVFEARRSTGRKGLERARRRTGVHALVRQRERA